MKIFLLIFMNLISRISRKNYKIVYDISKVCNLDFMNFYNLKGHKYPTKIEDNYICPFTKYNCCSVEDQYEIFKTMKYQVLNRLSLFKMRMKKTFENYKFFVKDLNDKLKLNYSLLYKEKSKVDFCEKAKNDFNSINNKKFLSHLNLIFQNSIDKFNLNKSVYCWVCDYNFHKNLNFNEKNILVNKKFCINFLKYFKDELIFFNSHFFQHLILSLKNVDCLYYKENFNFRFIDESRLEKMVQIQKCIEQINNNEINDNCLQLCQFFEIDSISTLFQGDLNFIETTVNYLKIFLKKAKIDLIAKNNIKIVKNDKFRMLGSKKKVKSRKLTLLKQELEVNFKKIFHIIELYKLKNKMKFLKYLKKNKNVLYKKQNQSHYKLMRKLLIFLNKEKKKFKYKNVAKKSINRINSFKKKNRKLIAPLLIAASLSQKNYNTYDAFYNKYKKINSIFYTFKDKKDFGKVKTIKPFDFLKLMNYISKEFINKLNGHYTFLIQIF